MHSLNTLLFLVGFMGSGKTTLARQLGVLTGLPYVDTDELIEQDALISIPELFRAHGERAFRVLERECLRRITLQQRTIIVSTGGGLPCHSGNMDLMLRSGIVVYLKLSVRELTLRLEGQASSRPLLAYGVSQPLDERIKELLVAREAYYEQAHVTLDAFTLSPQELLSSVEDYLSGSD